MRLTLLNQFYTPDISPTAHLCASLAEHRAAKGDDVTVVTVAAGVHLAEPIPLNVLLTESGTIGTRSSSSAASLRTAIFMARCAAPYHGSAAIQPCSTQCVNA